MLSFSEDAAARECLSKKFESIPGHTACIAADNSKIIEKGKSVNK